MLERLKRRHLGLPILMLVGGLTASVIVAAQLWRMIEAREWERFQRNVDQVQDAIEDRLDTYIAMLRAGAGLFAARRLDIKPEEFHAFVDRLQLPTRYPGIQGIGYTARVPAGEVDAFVAAVRREGRESFRIWPEEPRPEYHAILYLEPLDRRNRAAIGYDMFTDPTRRAAMERARDAGEPAASGKVALVQEIDERKQAGFLIYVPVYWGYGVPAGTAERRERLAGFVYSPFRADDLLEGIFGADRNPRIRFSVFDGAPAAGNLLHVFSGEAPAGPSDRDADARYRAARSFDVAGRSWTVAYATSPAFELSSNRPLAPLFLAGGVLASILVSGALWAQVRARNAAERELAERRKVEKRQRLLLDELNHRVKNSLATVQSIVTQTIRTSSSPEEFRAAFQARLFALSQAHNLLTHSNWEGAPLTDLLAGELAPYAANGVARFEIAGEEVWLKPNVAVALGMVFHELAINAAQHGALSAPGGRVCVSWDVRPSPDGERLSVRWTETGGPAVSRPSRRGFGSRLIERGLAHELGGEVTLLFEPDGVRCVMDLPLGETAEAA